jgi:hypothetical protein
LVKAISFSNGFAPITFEISSSLKLEIITQPSSGDVRSFSSSFSMTPSMGGTGPGLSSDSRPPASAMIRKRSSGERAATGWDQTNQVWMNDAALFLDLLLQLFLVVHRKVH